MSDTPSPELEKQLRELTAWQGPEIGLWRRALDAARAQSARARPLRLVTRHVPTWLGVSIAAAVLFIAVGAWMAHEGDFRRLQAKYAASPPAITGAPVLVPREPAHIAGGYASEGSLVARARDTDGAAQGYGLLTVEPDVLGGPAGRADMLAREGGQGLGPESVPLTERQVVRKATIELSTKDVRAAFLKAANLISEAQGEFVQDSGLTGSGDRLEGNLTLRVAATRLAEVLNELRQLGQVQSEKASGEDVTAQVVDVDARLRNEQRVETELLQLLEKRQDAPLKEILELRTSISGVRQTIEQLTAQRERLSRLVSLATVLVIIRPADAPPPVPKPEPTLGARFVDTLSGACQHGLLFLINTIAGFVSVIIGGLVWWVLLIVVVLVIQAYRRRAAKAAS